MKTVKKALDILDCFVKNDCELGITEIARQLDFNKSTTHSLLATLKDSGYVIFNQNSRKYSLGLKPLELTKHILFQKDLRDICLPVMKELAERTQEDISLDIPSGTNRICIAVTRGPQHVRMNITLGMSIPLYCGAGGKCLLAFMQKNDAQKMMEGIDFVRYTEKSILNGEQLFENLSTIRAQGYAESREEFLKDAAALAFPLYSGDGEIIAAYCIHSTVSRLTDDTRSQIISDGMEMAQSTNTILKNLNWSS